MVSVDAAKLCFCFASIEIRVSFGAPDCVMMRLNDATVPCALVSIRATYLFIRIHFACNEKSFN